MSFRYPLDLATNDVDYVTFKHLKYQETSRPGDPGSIILYMPNTTPAISNQEDWGPKKFEGPLGNITKSVLKTAAGAVSDIGTEGGGGRTVDDFKGMIEESTSNAPGAVKQLGVQGIASAAQMEPSQLMAMARGQIYNPNVELLYSGPQVRGFNFNYTFVPKSAAEAVVAANIVKEFKKWSAPLELPTGMWEIPDVWQVSYMLGGQLNPNMNVFKKAACTGITVQHNPGLPMHMSFKNGMPIITQIALSFMEVDVITRNDHDSAPNFGY